MCGFEAAAPSGYRHLLLRPSPITAGLLRVHAEDKTVRERCIVGGPVRRDGPTVLATEARIRGYRDRGLPWLQWMTTTPEVLQAACCRRLHDRWN